MTAMTDTLSVPAGFEQSKAIVDWETANRALINGIEERLEIIRSMGTIPDLSDHFGTIPELAEYFGPPSTPAERVEYSALVLIQLAMAFERHLAVRP